MTKSRMIVAAGFALAQMPLAVPAFAQNQAAPTGLYLGAGITQSRFDANTFTIDHKDNSWKLIAGFRMQENFAVEANYVDFGKATAAALPTGGPFMTKATAFSLFAVGIVPTPWVDLYAKVGAARTEAKGSIAGVQYKDSSTKFAYGAGVQFSLSNLAIRAEYEKYNTPRIHDLDLITLGATYTFRSAY